MEATLRLRSAPPLNRSSIPARLLSWKNLERLARSTPGTGTWATNRYMTSMARVKRTLPRRSGWPATSIMACSSLGLEDTVWVCCI